MRKRALFLLVLFLAAGVPARAMAVETSAAAAILMDADSGRILYEKEADRQMLIASTTKIMTALVAIEEGDLAQTVTVKRAYTLAEGSSMYLKEGEQLTLETLLYGLLLCSGNDAALAVADSVGGDGFVARMNERARELGMEHTSFQNPSGLDDENHYSTARDMAILAAAAMENQTFARIVSTKSVSIGGRLMTNHNKLLRLVEGCEGIKTGYTRAAGRTLVSSASRNGQRLVAVTLCDGNDWADHAALYDYGFSAYPAQKQIRAGETAGSVRVKDGEREQVSAVAVRGFSYPLAEGESLRREVELADTVDAPVSRGDSLGTVRFFLGEELVGEVELVSDQDAALKLPEPVSFLQRIFPFLP